MFLEVGISKRVIAQHNTNKASNGKGNKACLRPLQFMVYRQRPCPVSPQKFCYKIKELLDPRLFPA
jgi:hypothetical protein